MPHDAIVTAQRLLAEYPPPQDPVIIQHQRVIKDLLHYLKVPLTVGHDL